LLLSFGALLPVLFHISVLVQVHLYNSLHRGVGILVERPRDGAIFVHQRSNSKRIFPAVLYELRLFSITFLGQEKLTEFPKAFTLTVSFFHV